MRGRVGLVALALVAVGIVVLRATTGPVDPEPITEPDIVQATLPDPTAAAAEPVKYFTLTDEERYLVEQVVMAEAGGEDYDGQRLVAQCILNACLREGMRPDEVIIAYQYTSIRKEPSESVCAAVAAVFDAGDTVTEEAILYFYAPAICTSTWHESQRFVLEHGGHRFFALWEEVE